MATERAFIDFALLVVCPAENPNQSSMNAAQFLNKFTDYFSRVATQSLNTEHWTVNSISMYIYSLVMWWLPIWELKN